MMHILSYSHLVVFDRENWVAPPKQTLCNDSSLTIGDLSWIILHIFAKDYRYIKTVSNVHR